MTFRNLLTEMLRPLLPSTNDAEWNENKTRRVWSDDVPRISLSNKRQCQIRWKQQPNTTTRSPLPHGALCCCLTSSTFSPRGRVETTWHIMGTVQPQKAHINASICFCLVHCSSFASESHCLRRRRPRRKLSVRKGVCGVKP